MPQSDLIYPVSKPTLNWPLVIAISTGILTIIVLITVFFIIPHYATRYLDDKIQGELDDLNGNISTYGCSSDVYNCGDFTTQSEAQNVYDYCIEEGTGDIHQLDNDGVICAGLA